MGWHPLQIFHLVSVLSICIGKRRKIHKIWSRRSKLKTPCRSRTHLLSCRSFLLAGKWSCCQMPRLWLWCSQCQLNGIHIRRYSLLSNRPPRGGSLREGKMSLCNIKVSTHCKKSELLLFGACGSKLCLACYSRMICQGSVSTAALFIPHVYWRILQKA